MFPTEACITDAPMHNVPEVSRDHLYQHRIMEMLVDRFGHQEGTRLWYTLDPVSSYHDAWVEAVVLCAEADMRGDGLSPVIKT